MAHSYKASLPYFPHMDIVARMQDEVPAQGLMPMAVYVLFDITAAEREEYNKLLHSDDSDNEECDYFEFVEMGDGATLEDVFARHGDTIKSVKHREELSFTVEHLGVLENRQFKENGVLLVQFELPEPEDQWGEGWIREHYEEKARRETEKEARNEGQAYVDYFYCVPEMTSSVWCNIEIANMDWDEFKDSSMSNMALRTPKKPESNVNKL